MKDGETCLNNQISFSIKQTSNGAVIYCFGPIPIDPWAWSFWLWDCMFLNLTKNGHLSWSVLEHFHHLRLNDILMISKETLVCYTHLSSQNLFQQSQWKKSSKTIPNNWSKSKYLSKYLSWFVYVYSCWRAHGNVMLLSGNSTNWVRNRWDCMQNIRSSFLTQL